MSLVSRQFYGRYPLLLNGKFSYKEFLAFYRIGYDVAQVTLNMITTNVPEVHAAVSLRDKHK